jgi:putative PEP-CTERM system integral membrane protein
LPLKLQPYLNLTMKKLVHFSYSSIFWLWNCTFLLLAYGLTLPQIGFAFSRDIWVGVEIPATLVASLLGLLIVPTVCTGVGWFRLRKQPVSLIRLFYGVEAPLVGLCLLRLFLIRELTPASSQILGTVLFCIGAFAVELLCGFAAQKRTLAWLQLASHSLMLIVGVYVGALLALYTIPLLWVTVASVVGWIIQFLHFDWIANLPTLSVELIRLLWWVPVFMFLFGLSCSLFLAMPFVMANFYLRSWWRVAAAFGTRYGQFKAVAGTAGVAIAWLLLFMSLQQQPQIQAFELLSQPAQTEGDRQELLAKSDLIQAGLVNAYLNSYRYVSPWEESNRLREIYRSVFNLSQANAQVWQNLHNHLLSPFLYSGSRADADRAANLYAEFFDAPIQKAERETIQHALQSTSNRDETKAGLLNINQQIVWLAQQRVNVHEHGDWADIELYERYENSTWQDQEIFYSFSLPESAVLTGVWLGDSMSRANRFPFTVSPRGAAQQVYTGEVARSTNFAAEDPALLEQVGPQQYRLRVFPIPRQQPNGQPGKLHLWMTYQVMRQEQGWPMPHLAEKRNIFWTKETVRRRNGKAARQLEEAWLETALPARRHAPQTHVTLIGGYQVTAEPLSRPTLPQSKRFALVLDRSRSMATHTDELTKTFHWLVQHRADNDLELYLTASAGAQPERLDDISEFDLTQATFYGNLSIHTMLQQFEQLRGERAYDAVLVITDEGNYELTVDKAKLPAIASPLWAIHLGGLPPAYDDSTLETLQQTKGGISTDIAEAMQRIATEETLGQVVASVTDGYIWTVAPVQSDTGETLDSTSLISVQATTEADFTPLAARQLILKLSRDRDMTQITELDAIHQLAKATEIVTPYSSMLVLVNDRQRELLAQAEVSGDRFEREVEDGLDQLTQPNNPLNVATVPEPGNVVGMGIVAIALLLFTRNSRSSKNRYLPKK